MLMFKCLQIANVLCIGKSYQNSTDRFNIINKNVDSVLIKSMPEIIKCL